MNTVSECVWSINVQWLSVLSNITLPEICRCSRNSGKNYSLKTLFKLLRIQQIRRRTYGRKVGRMETWKMTSTSVIRIRTERGKWNFLLPKWKMVNALLRGYRKVEIIKHIVEVYPTIMYDGGIEKLHKSDSET